MPAPAAPPLERLQAQTGCAFPALAAARERTTRRLAEPVEEFAAGRCEDATRRHRRRCDATAARSLRGGVYLVRPPGQHLPNMVVASRG